MEFHADVFMDSGLRRNDEKGATAPAITDGRRFIRLVRLPASVV
jgi:hypothetical protein